MSSKKGLLRNVIILVFTIALATAIFTGCNKQTSTAPPVSSTSQSTVMETTTQVEGKTPKSSNFTIFWAEGSETVKSFKDTLAESRATGTKTDLKTVHASYTDENGKAVEKDLFDVYKTAEDKLFIISGCNIIYLTEDGNVPANELRTLRLEESNIKVNVYSDANFYNEAQKMAKTFIDETGGGRTAITPIGEREAFRSKGIGESYLTGSKTIWLNGQATSFHADQSYISLEGLIKLGIESGVIMSGDEFPCTFNNRLIAFTINTAGGKMTVEITRDGDNVPDVTTKTLTNEGKVIEKSFKDAASFQSIGGQFSMGFESIQEILGWDLDVYDNSINVVTDIQDIQSPDTIILSSNVTAVSFVKEDLGVDYEINDGTGYVKDGVDYSTGELTYVRRGDVTYEVDKDKNGNRIEIPYGEAWISLPQSEKDKYKEAMGMDMRPGTDGKTWADIKNGPTTAEGAKAAEELNNKWFK